jgi:hypothetical protein
MNALKFGLDWFVDEKGYRVEGADNSRTIVPMGGDLRRIKPLEKDRLFHTFAQVGSDADLLNFVENYGLLETQVIGLIMGRQLLTQIPCARFQIGR